MSAPVYQGRGFWRCKLAKGGGDQCSGRHGSSTATVSPVTLIRRFDRTAKGRLMYVSARQHYLVWTVGAPTEHTLHRKLSMQYVSTEQTRKPISMSFGAESPSRSSLTMLMITLHNHGFSSCRKGPMGGYRRLLISIPSPNRQRELKNMDLRRGRVQRLRSMRWMAVCSLFQSWIRKAAVEILAEVETDRFQIGACRGRELGMSAAELEQFADAFEHREREVAQFKSSGKGGVKKTGFGSATPLLSRKS